jgi:hypothetical protein
MLKLEDLNQITIEELNNKGIKSVTIVGEMGNRPRLIVEKLDDSKDVYEFEEDINDFIDSLKN